MMMSRSLALALVFASAANAIADGNKPTKEDENKYAAALERGRKAEAARKFDEAAAAFEDALRILPDDAVALSELGTVQLATNQLEPAEATSRKAVARSQTVSVRAASLYNLGLILAKRGDKPGAIEAFKGALRLRAHPIVKAALAKLDAAAANEMRYVPTPMHASTAADAKAVISEQCWKSVAEAWPDLGVKPADANDKDHFECHELPVKLALGGTPFLDVKVLQSLATYQYPKEVETLAIRTAQGWFVTPIEKFWTNRWTDGTGKVTSVELSDVGTTKAVVVHWDLIVSDWPWDVDPSKVPYDGEGRVETTTNVMIAGVGGSGIPSATPAIVVGQVATYGPDDAPHKPAAAATLDVSFPRSGGITLVGPHVAKTTVPAKKFADLLASLTAGAYPLEFP